MGNNCGGAAPLCRFCKECVGVKSVKHRLERRYGLGHLHFITSSCYRRLPFLGTSRARDVFLKVLSEVRNRYDFCLLGYVVMPEHIHLLVASRIWEILPSS